MGTRERSALVTYLVTHLQNGWLFFYVNNYKQYQKQYYAQIFHKTHPLSFIQRCAEQSPRPDYHIKLTTYPRICQSYLILL